MTQPTGLPPITLRPVTGSDLPAVLEVYRQCEDFLALGPEPHASPEMVAADLQLTNDEGGVFYGIYAPDDTLVGIVAYTASHYEGDPRLAFLGLLMIAAPYRSRGYGAAVVTQVETDVRSQPGLRTILSGVQVNNPAAIRFWQAHGYQITSAAEPMPDGTTVYRLRKDLAPPNQP